MAFIFVLVFMAVLYSNPVNFSTTAHESKFIVSVKWELVPWELVPGKCQALRGRPVINFTLNLNLINVISDTSVLIAFEALGKLPALKKIFPQIIIPEGVYNELLKRIQP